MKSTARQPIEGQGNEKMERTSLGSELPFPLSKRKKCVFQQQFHATKNSEGIPRYSCIHFTYFAVLTSMRRFSLRKRNVTQSGVEVKIEEYAPLTKPTSKAKEKFFVVSPPNQ